MQQGQAQGVRSPACVSTAGACACRSTARVGLPCLPTMCLRSFTRQARASSLAGAGSRTRQAPHSWKSKVRGQGLQEARGRTGTCSPAATACSTAARLTLVRACTCLGRRAATGWSGPPHVRHHVARRRHQLPLQTWVVLACVHTCIACKARRSTHSATASRHCPPCPCTECARPGFQPVAGKATLSFLIQPNSRSLDPFVFSTPVGQVRLVASRRPACLHCWATEAPCMLCVAKSACPAHVAACTCALTEQVPRLELFVMEDFGTPKLYCRKCVACTATASL